MVEALVHFASQRDCFRAIQLCAICAGLLPVGYCEARPAGSVLLEVQTLLLPKLPAAFESGSECMQVAPTHTVAHVRLSMGTCIGF